MKPINLYLLIGLLFVVNVCNSQAITTIDGVYLERDSTSSSVKNDTIINNDIIVFDIPGIGDYLQDNRILLRDVKLLLNNVVLTEFPAYMENLEAGTVRFKFSQKHITSQNRQLLYNMPGGATKEMLLGLKVGDTIISYSHRVPVFFATIKNWSLIGILLIALFFFFFLIIVLKYKSLITDNVSTLGGAVGTASYSFGKSQLAFWTFIVIASFIYIWSFTTDLNSINSTGLILLGISSATLAAGSLVSNREELNALKNNTTAELILARTTEHNFFKDILSDNSGINIHRFQSFIFNIIFGIAFLKTVILNYSMPDFDETQLLLLGISNGTYTFLKSSENR